MGERWPDRVKDRVVEMHMAGEPVKAIIAETGVPQATQYAWLRERGIMPTRQPRGPGRPVDSDQLLLRIEANARKIGELEAEVRRLKSRLSEYESHEGNPIK